MKEQAEWAALIASPQITLAKTERWAFTFCKEDQSFGGRAWLILNYQFLHARTKLAQERNDAWLRRAYPNVTGVR